MAAASSVSGQPCYSVGEFPGSLVRYIKCTNAYSGMNNMQIALVTISSPGEFPYHLGSSEDVLFNSVLFYFALSVIISARNATCSMSMSQAPF